MPESEGQFHIMMVLVSSLLRRAQAPRGAVCPSSLFGETTGAQHSFPGLFVPKASILSEFLRLLFLYAFWSCDVKLVPNFALNQ